MAEPAAVGLTLAEENAAQVVHELGHSVEHLRAIQRGDVMLTAKDQKRLHRALRVILRKIREDGNDLGDTDG